MYFDLSTVFSSFLTLSLFTYVIFYGQANNRQKKARQQAPGFFHYDCGRRYLSSVIFMVFVYPPDFTV